MHDKISTRLGTAILIIIAITAVMFVWTYEKGQDWGGITTQPQIIKKKSNVENVVTEPVKQWTTCKNVETGYQVSYPNSWSAYTKDGNSAVLSNCNNKAYSIVFFPGKEGSIDLNPTKTYIEVGYELMNRDPKGFFYQTSTSLDEYLSRVGHSQILKEVSINGEKAVVLDDFPNPIIVTYHDNKVITLSGNNISEKIFNDFLSTFKFLK